MYTAPAASFILKTKRLPGTTACTFAGGATRGAAKGFVRPEPTVTRVPAASPVVPALADPSLTRHNRTSPLQPPTTSVLPSGVKAKEVILHKNGQTKSPFGRRAWLGNTVSDDR